VIFRRLFGRTQQEEQQKQEVALTKTRRTNLFSSLFERSTIDEDLYEDLEAALIGSDVGVETT
jgi:signal recognition particle GTPase